MAFNRKEKIVTLIGTQLYFFTIIFLTVVMLPLLKVSFCKKVTWKLSLGNTETLSKAQEQQRVLFFLCFC